MASPIELTDEQLSIIKEINSLYKPYGTCDGSSVVNRMQALLEASDPPLDTVAGWFTSPFQSEFLFSHRTYKRFKSEDSNVGGSMSRRGSRSSSSSSSSSRSDSKVPCHVPCGGDGGAT